MTIEEAFEEIGLSPGAPAGEIRRGYLRKLKTRKPEVDPEGFRRLRDAYETLSDRLREDEPEVAPTFSMVFVPDAPAPAWETSTPTPPPSPEASAPAPLSPESVFAHLLELHARGALAEAAEVEARFRERLHASGQELRLFDSDLSILWSVVQELGRLDDVFPQEARTAIARAMLAGDLLAAFPEVYRIARAAPERAVSIATRLYPLPVLCVFHTAFEIPRPPIESGLPPLEKVGAVWGRILQAVFVVGFLFSVFRSPSSQSLASFQEVPNPPEPVSYYSVEFAMGEVCRPSLRAQGMEWLCMAAEGTIQEMQRADCHGIAFRSMDLRREVNRFETTPVAGVPLGAPRGLFEAIERRARMICGDFFK